MYCVCICLQSIIALISHRKVLSIEILHHNASFPWLSWWTPILTICKAISLYGIWLSNGHKKNLYVYYNLQNQSLKCCLGNKTKRFLDIVSNSKMSRPHSFLPSISITYLWIVFIICTKVNGNSNVPGTIYKRNLS